MTMIQYAFFRAASKRMTPGELAVAIALAELADAGDEDAYNTLLGLALQKLKSPADSGRADGSTDSVAVTPPRTPAGSTR
jgi:hypothetical protein